MKFAAYKAFSFIIFCHILRVPFFIIIYMFCMLLFNFVNPLFLLLYLCILIVMFMFSYYYVIFYSVNSVSLCRSEYFVRKCVMYYSHRVSNQLQLNNIISYHIIYFSAKIHITYLQKKVYLVLQLESGFLVCCKVFAFQKRITELACKCRQ